MRPGEAYWALVEPHWKRVSIYDGADLFLREYRATPEVPRHLLAGHWCQSEVCNGGFHQFFYNPTGVLAPEADLAYRAIGLPGLADVVQRAMTFFGPEYLRNQESRCLALEAYKEKHGRVRTFFEPLDNEFYALVRKERGGWEQAADNFARTRGGPTRS